MRPSPAQRCARLLAAIPLAPAAMAQCTPQWLPADGSAASPIFNDSGITLWDPDGAGPLGACITIGSMNAGAEPGAYWDGHAWRTFPMGTHAPILALCAYNGDLIAAGQPGFYSYGGGTVNNAPIARFDGSRWWPLGTPAGAAILSACTWNGAVYTASGAVGGLRRWDGASWTTLPDPAGVSLPRALAVINGQLMAGGTGSARLATWNGSAWTPWSSTPPPIGEVRTIAWWNGQLVIGPTMYAWTGAAWQALPGIPASSLLTQGPDLYGAGTSLPNRVGRWVGGGPGWTPLGSALNAPVYVVARGAAGTYIGGVFFASGATQLPGIARYSNGAFTRLGSSPSSVHAVAVDSTDVYAAAGTTVYRWDGNTWTSYPPFTANTYALALSGGALIAGGDFSSAIRVWAGTEWQAVGGGLSSGASTPAVYALLSQGSDLYAAGDFATAGGTPAANIARWDGGNWHNLASGLDASALALTVFGSDLIVGGNFATAGGAPALHIARWDGQAFSPMGEGFNAGVAALAVHDGELYAAGPFTASGATVLNRVARWDGHAWQPLTTGIQVGSVFALGDTGDELLIGGSFQTAGGQPASFLAHWGCPPSPPCYANCDGSTAAPVLNVNDFTCFLNRFAAGDSSANCDGSTTPPILNVNDFTCFLNAFAAGCP